MSALKGARSFCLVVETRSDEWIAPLDRFIRNYGEFDRTVTRTADQARRKDESTGPEVLRRLADGGRVAGIASRFGYLPEAMITGADLKIELPRITTDIIETVIRRMSGKRVTVSPAVARLGFADLVACLRSSDTAAANVARLERAASTVRSITPIGDDIPHIKDLHGYGAAKTWALELIEDVEAWRRGEIDFGSIASRNCVLVSPPGLGKSTYAKSLAKSLGVPLLATSVGQWFSSSSGHLDAIIKQIDAVFAAAAAAAPAVLLLDELDGMPNRARLDSRNSDWWMPVVNRPHRGLEGATPRSAWERDTARFTPSEVTPAQRRAAFGVRHPDVAPDAQGVLYLDISYASEALAELRRIYDGRVNLVIDPEDLGDVFVEIPLRHRKHMQAFAPIAMHGAFLEVPAVDRRFAGRTLATHLLLNEGVRKYGREAKQKGDIVRIEANESLTMQGRLAAQRAGIASNALTQEEYDKISRQYRAKARQSTGQDPVRDEPTPGGQAGMGKVVATSRRTRPPAKPPKPLDLHDGADNGDRTSAADEHVVPGAESTRGKKAADTVRPAPAPRQDTPPAAGMPRPSRSINQGDDD